MKLVLEFRRHRPAHQRVFDFSERSRRHERWFKFLILVATGLTLAILLGGLPGGRYLVAVVVSQARRTGRHLLGLPAPRSEIDAAWKQYRLYGMDESRRALEK